MLLTYSLFCSSITKLLTHVPEFGKNVLEITTDIPTTTGIACVTSLTILDLELLKNLYKTKQDFLMETLSIHSPSLRYVDRFYYSEGTRFRGLEEQLNFIASCCIQGKMHMNQRNDLNQALQKQKQNIQEQEGKHSANLTKT